MKALIIQSAFLGDAILSLSLAEELRRLMPGARICYLVRPEVAPVLDCSPAVDEVFSYDKYGSESGLSGIRHKADELNTEGFDVVFTLHSSKRTRMLLQRLQAPQKIGYGDLEELTHPAVELQEPQTAKAVRLLLPLFPAADVRTLPKLVPKENTFASVISALPRPIVTLATDSVWKTKQWGYEKFSALIELLKSERISIILTGINKSPLLEQVSNSLESNVLDLTAKTDLHGLISIISTSDLLVSNDSAPVHIATATRTKSVVIFGPTVPEFGFAPPPELGLVVQDEGLWCRPCASHGSNECPIHTHECMTSISPARVMESIRTSLGVAAAGA
ncbi:MAG: glycosyltransferase family 9 protein [Bacteroidota bacterium]|nr:glycosyltransferase family 9 protein [Bacteroidota bacterium]